MRGTTLLAAAGYALGGFPSADLASRLSHRVDLREHGSGKPGAANAMRVLGRRWGLAVAVADVGKGVVAGAAGGRIAGDVGAHAACVGAVGGHCHPARAGMRGGKGVAASFGQCIATLSRFRR
jgi:glycerol-3-phosphate acyltransferase PlsY